MANTTRNQAGQRPALLHAVIALLCALVFAGCATPGPMHVYTVARESGEQPPILDLAEGHRAEVPSYLEADDQLTGFAYDPFTDHFFLRLAPGNKIRVVDRPARAIKREFTIDDLPANGGGDLAVRPRDGHIFFLDPQKNSVTETSRLGKVIRHFELQGAGPVVGIAHDATAGRLFVLNADSQGVSLHDTDGNRQGVIQLDRAVAASLAVDGERRELFAPLVNVRAIGVFDFNGKFLRQIETGEAKFVDVGPRSFVRVF